MADLVLHRNFFQSLNNLRNEIKQSKIGNTGISLELNYEGSDFFLVIHDSVSHLYTIKHDRTSTIISLVRESKELIKLYDTFHCKIGYIERVLSFSEVADWLDETDDDMDSNLIRLSETNKIRAFESVEIRSRVFVGLEDLTNISNGFSKILKEESY